MNDDFATPGLIEWASLLCGVGTVLMSIYIAAVRFGFLP